MSMSRKDYTAIAEAISDQVNENDARGNGIAVLALTRVATAIGNKLAESNERFDFWKFYNAATSIKTIEGRTV